MTNEEQAELNEWLGAITAKQPFRTLAIIAYVRDGQVTVQHEVKDFPSLDLPTVQKLMDDSIDRLVGANIPE